MSLGMFWLLGALRSSSGAWGFWKVWAQGMFSSLGGLVVSRELGGGAL